MQPGTTHDECSVPWQCYLLEAQLIAGAYLRAVSPE